jgi:hypothetical protein
MVMPEEDEISLIMKRDHSPTFKLWSLGKDGRQKPSNSMS